MYILLTQSFSGVVGHKAGWRHGVNNNIVFYTDCANRLEQIHKRLLGVQIECESFEYIIENYDTPDTWFYFDPPYVIDTRRHNDGYCHEMSNDAHRRLVDMLLQIQGKALVSCYYHDIYKPLIDAGWNMHKWDVICRAKIQDAVKMQRTEVLIYNYDVYKQLSLLEGTNEYQ